MTTKASLGRVLKCLDCPFVWSMRIGGDAPVYTCAELTQDVNPMKIPENCPLPDFVDMIVKYMPTTAKEMAKRGQVK